MNDAAAFLVGGDPDDAQYCVTVEAEGFVPVAMYVPVISEHMRVQARRLLQAFAEMSNTPDIGEKTSGRLPPLHGGVIPNVDFTLEPSASISGRLTDSSGAPLAKRYLFLARAAEKSAGTMMQGPVYRGLVETGADGEFVFQSLPSGEYSFKAGLDLGTVSVKGPRVILAPGEECSGLEFTADAPAPGAIEAVVRDAVTGAAVLGAAIEVLRVTSPGLDDPSHGRLVESTDSSGAFRVEAIAPGTAVIRVRAPGYAIRDVEAQVVSGETTRLEVPYERAGAARVTLVPAVKLPSSDAMMAFWAETGDGTAWQSSEESTGVYRLEGLRPGRHYVTAYVYSGEVYRRAVALVRVTSEAVTDVTLDFGGDSGLLVRLSGDPRTNVNIAASPVDAPAYPPSLSHLAWRASIRARVAGDYEMKSLPPATTSSP